VSSTRSQMTAEDLEQLRAELAELEGEGRRQIAARIKTAREWGDLSENAEYHAAKNDQAHLETRIARLRTQIQDAVVVQRPGGGAAATVEFGVTVSYTDQGSGRTQQHTIVAAREANPREGKLSVASPIATALIGRRVGDTVEVSTPAGMRKLVIDAIA
jgi:transcription elongation factor GreA